MARTQSPDSGQGPGAPPWWAATPQPLLPLDGEQEPLGAGLATATALCKVLSQALALPLLSLCSQHSPRLQETVALQQLGRVMRENRLTPVDAVTPV